MPIRTIKVSSLGEYVDATLAQRDEWFKQRAQLFDPWFRGQRCADWSLRPSLFVRDMGSEDDDLRNEFRRRALQLLDERSAPTSDWEWYFLMQHHGVPTRLLDWTDSALVGLFFAVNSSSPHDHEVVSDAAVWMLDPWWLNKVTIKLDVVVESDWAEAEPWLPEVFDGSVRRRLPLALDPPHVAKRITAQRGHFTVFGTRPNGLELVAARKGARLRKFVIAKEAIAGIRLDLDTLGISESTVFPDVEGLARELTRQWTTQLPAHLQRGRNGRRPGSSAKPVALQKPGSRIASSGRKQPMARASK